MTDIAPNDAAADFAAIDAALRGDAAARATVATRLQVVGRLLESINAHRGSPLSSHELEDIRQDVIAIVWEKFRRFEGVGTLESWLYRFCLNAFHNRSRLVSQRARRVTTLVDDPPDPTVSDDDGIEPSDLESALRELGPPREEVLRLKHEEELSFEGIAQRLGLSSSTVKTRYYEGVRWLRWRLTRGQGDRP
jgi:RNA polymerase sigma factor (sigma-70 family)